MSRSRPGRSRSGRWARWGYGHGATPLIPTLRTANGYYLGGRPGCVASASQVCYANLLTTTTGNFITTGSFICTAGQPIYHTATAGRPIPGKTNAALATPTGYGICGASNNLAFISVNAATDLTLAVTYTKYFLQPSGIATEQSGC